MLVHPGALILGYCNIGHPGAIIWMESESGDIYWDVNAILVTL